MADKQYFEMHDAEGVVCIAHEVVAAMAAEACAELPGVAAMAQVAGAEHRGVVIRPEGAQGAALDVHIMVRMGHELAAVARLAQEAVKTAVETGAGIALSAVNVFVAGVSLKSPWA